MELTTIQVLYVVWESHDVCWSNTVPEAVSYGEIFSRNICPKFLPTNISPPHDFTVQKFLFLVFMAGSEGVSIRGDRGKKEREHFSLVCAFRILYHVCCFTHIQRTICPRNWRDLYGNPTKFSQANQTTISYVPDPLVVTKSRYRGQQDTSWWHPAAFTTMVRKQIW